jgi:hypothetical protein
MTWFAAVKTATGIALVEECDYQCGAVGTFGYLVDGRMRWFCASHRPRQWSADACRSETDSARAQAGLGIENAGMPDLQALVAAHGGYDKITPEAWAEYDAAMNAWQAQRKEKLRRR